MIDSTKMLKTLIDLPGLSGREYPVSETLKTYWQPLADEIQETPLGSLHAIKKATTPSREGRTPRILLAAHMDGIGLITTQIINGFIRFTNIGGVDYRILPGQIVTIHGKENLTGVVVKPPDNLLPAECAGKTIDKKYLFIDTGYSASEVERLVRVGDFISFGQRPLEMADNQYILGHSIDNRASVVAVTLCLEALQHRQHAWDVVAAATIQEEFSMAGARTSTYDTRPDLAIAIDVTFAEGPGAHDYWAFPLDSGPTLGWSPSVHPALHKTFKAIADEIEMPYSIEYMPNRSGTDADLMQTAIGGIPTMVISIPERYMHTPTELVSMKDIQRTGRLLAEFISRLSPDYLETLSWDD
jgi:endoglucanase